MFWHRMQWQQQLALVLEVGELLCRKRVINCRSKCNLT
jgi:hypothetical protein